MTDCTFEIGNNAVAVISLVINAVLVPLIAGLTIKIHKNTKPDSSTQ